MMPESSALQSLAILDFGLAPKGGEAYFLKKRLRHCKAFEILLSEKEITAKDALKLGAVNKVVPLYSLEKSTLNMAQEFAKKPSDSLTVIKRLLNYSEQNLTDYLEFENQELMHSLGFTTLNNRFSFNSR